MVVKHLVVNLEEDEWRDMMVVRALMGCDSWNEFFHNLVMNPSDFIINLVRILKQRNNNNKCLNDSPNT